METNAMQVLGTHHVALCTPNFEALRDFYTKTLGMVPIGSFSFRNIVYLAAGDITIELVERLEPPNVSRQGWVHLAFEVEDVQKSYETLSAKGVPFHILPQGFPEDSPVFKMAFFKDPDGNDIELVQPLIDGYPQL
ncbi:VOC family protein [Chloroflexia bacterium SDU3-3]|nr:VOC family protein [Chloroflexia bacterium SDU3-3]